LLIDQKGPPIEKQMFWQFAGLEPKWKNSNNLREAIVAAYKSLKSYKAISKQFQIHHSTVRQNIHKWKT